MTKRTKRNITAAAADTLLAAAACALLIYSGRQIKEVSLQPAADLWSGGDTPYTVSSIYFAEDSSRNIDGIYALRNSLKRKLTEQSIQETNDEGGRNYIDCWYGSVRTEFFSEKNSAAADAFFVGGDYFRIHLPDIISGSVISPDDINTNCIVLDENASWLLFGAVDTAGMTVSAGGTEFTVTGVIAAPNKKGPMKRAYDEMKSVCVYLPYQASEITGGEIKFTGYDALLPDRVRGFAQDIMKSAANVKDETFNISVKESRSRYRLNYLKNYSKDMSRFVSRRNTAVIPFWETAAREVELDLTICFMAGVVLAVPAVISLGYWLVELYLLILRIKNKTVGNVSRMIEARKMEAYLKKQQAKKQNV